MLGLGLAEEDLHAMDSQPGEPLPRGVMSTEVYIDSGENGTRSNEVYEIHRNDIWLRKLLA